MSGEYSADDDSLVDGSILTTDIAIISPVPISSASSSTTTVDDVHLQLLTGSKYGNKKQKLEMILNILRDRPEQNFTGESLTIAKDTLFIHRNQTDANLSRTWQAKDCAEWFLILEPLLLETKKEWAMLRSSSRSHVSSNANKLSPMATKILKIVEDSRSKATSDYAILKAKQDKHLANLRNVNPSKPRLQDPFRFDPEKVHHIACPNCEHSSVMALEDEAVITAKNKAIDEAHTEKVCSFLSSFLKKYRHHLILFCNLSFLP